MMSLMGFMVLMGTVVNNGIVFVDYTNQLRLEGVEKRRALVLTGQARMRPILMTALTTILSMCSLIFSQSTTAAASRGMAIVVAGGLAYATLMTLFVVPVMYDIFYRKQPRVIDLTTRFWTIRPDCWSIKQTDQEGPVYSTGPSFWHGKTGRPWSLPVCYVRKCGSALFVKVLDPFVPLGIVDVDGSALAQQRHGIVLGVVQEVGLIVALKMLGVIDQDLGMVPS